MPLSKGTPVHSPAGISIKLPPQIARDRAILTVASAVLILGVASVTADCLNMRQPPVFNLHLLFGISLWLAVGRRLIRERSSCDIASIAHYNAYTRQLSRWVYILLYLLAAVRLMFHLSEVLGPSNGRHGAGLPAPHSLDDFQIYIAYALVPLWAIRFLVLYAPRSRRERVNSI